MTISIVIPVYNVQTYLKECLESVLNQTKKVNQIILIDDCSTDDSGNICDNYAKLHNYIVVVHKKKNEGLGMARNSGLNIVDSDYVMFLDSDDYLDSDYIERMHELIGNKRIQTVKNGYRKVSLNGKTIDELRTTSQAFYGKEVTYQLLPRIIGSSPYEKDSVPMSACCTLYSMEVINKHHIRFVSEREWISEDQLFNIEYFSHATSCALNDYIGYNYRTNFNSLTTKFIPDRFEKCRAMYVKESEVLSTIIPKEKWELRLNRQFMNYLRMCFSQLKKSVSGFGYIKSYRYIKSITDNKLVCSVVNNYPLEYLNLPQKVFVQMVKYRANLALYFMFCIVKVN